MPKLTLIRCAVCQNIIQFGNKIRREFHMKLTVIRSLKLKDEIPHLCSESCCDRFVNIRNGTNYA